MRKLLLSLAILLASAPAFADVTTIVTSKVTNYSWTRAFKGAVVVVVDHGYYYWYQYGARSNTDPMLITTPIAIASNTKTFVGAALALTDKYTTTKLDTELHDITSIVSGSPPYHATLEDLVSYYGGLPRDLSPAPATRSALFDTLSNCSCFADPCFAPQTQNLYSNYGFQVLGNALAKVWGYSYWHDLNTDLVTAPLGMDKTCVRGDGCHPNFSTSHAHAYDFAGNEVSLPNYSDITAPGGELWSTAQDMAIWLRYQLGFISSSTPELAKLNAVLPAQRTKLPSGSGYSWQFKNLTFSDGIPTKVRFKLGRYQGLNSYIGIADSRQTAVFVFVNRDGSDPNVEDPSTVLKDELGEKILAQFP